MNETDRDSRTLQNLASESEQIRKRLAVLLTTGRLEAQRHRMLAESVERVVAEIQAMKQAAELLP